MANEQGTRVALVTGASSGIGAAVAKRLAKDGFSVTVNYAGNKAEAEKVVSEIVSAGGKAIAVKADVGNAAEAKALFDQTEAAFGSISVLINNAGRAIRKQLSSLPMRSSNR